MRITNAMMSRNLLANVARSTARLARFQEQIATGKRIARPSDDPSATARILGGRTRIANIDQLLRNAERSVSSLGTIDSALGEVGGILGQAREVALLGANATVTDQDREGAAIQVDAMIERLLQIGNTFDGARFVFGGHKTLDAPFVRSSGGIEYQGDDAETVAPVDVAQEVPFLMPGSRAFRVAPATLGGDEDLDPDIWEFTRVADLNRGAGVALGPIAITDSDGATATIDLFGATTVKEILDRINAAGLSVAAGLNAEGDGIALANLGGGTTISVADVGDGIAASGLGIRGAFAGGVQGSDLDAAVTETTPLALLRGGLGVTVTTLSIANEIDGERREADVDLSFARSVGDVLVGLARAATPEGESLHVEGAIDASGSAFLVRSSLPVTRLTVRDASGPIGSTGAADLAVDGTATQRDLLAVLERLRDALREDDQDGIEEALALIDDGLSQNLLARAEIGSRVERVDTVRESLIARRADAESALSGVEDTDLPEAIVRSNQEQVAYQAALTAASRTLSLSLMDFLR